MRDLRETIKQKTIKAKLIEDYVRGTRNLYRKGDCTFEGFCKIQDEKFVALEVILAELINYKLIPLEKWQEIVELIKNRPSHESMYKNLDKIEKCEEWFEVLDAKVAELEVKE